MRNNESCIVVVERIPPEEGGGYTAYVVKYKDTYVGDGDSPAEALESLAESIRFVDEIKGDGKIQ